MVKRELAFTGHEAPDLEWILSTANTATVELIRVSGGGPWSDERTTKRPTRYLIEKRRGHGG
jgi:hypothetical protein